MLSLVRAKHDYTHVLNYCAWLLRVEMWLVCGEVKLSIYSILESFEIELPYVTRLAALLLGRQAHISIK